MSCLYCGKKRGLAFFRKDEFCSDEHRRLWQERESSNLVQRLTEAPERGEGEPLRLPRQPSVDRAPAQIPAPKGVKQLEGTTPGRAASPDVQIVIARQPYVAPATETPRLAPPEPKSRRFRTGSKLGTATPQLSERSPHCGRSTRNRKPRTVSHGRRRNQSGGCLYCGKKRGLALFNRDGFCSAEHRQLWQERESSNLVQRLIEAGTGGEREPLRLSKRPSTDAAPARTSPSEILRELKASLGTPAAPPNDETVSTPPAVEQVTETSPAEPADPVVAGFLLPPSIHLEHHAAPRNGPIWTTDAHLETPDDVLGQALCLPASRAVVSTGFAASQTRVRIQACDAEPIANADKRLNAIWPDRAPLDTAFLVESRKPGPCNSAGTPIPVQALTLHRTTVTEDARRDRSHAGSILSRIQDVTISSRTPELTRAFGAVEPVLSNLTHSTAAVDMVPGGAWPVRTLTLAIGSVEQGLTEAEFVNLPTEPLSAYTRAGVCGTFSQSFRPSLPHRAFEPQLVIGDYSKLPLSFIAPGASVFIAVPDLAGREVNIGTHQRGRPALPGLCFIPLPFQALATVPNRPTVLAVAALPRCCHTLANGQAQACDCKSDVRDSAEVSPQRACSGPWCCRRFPVASSCHIATRGRT